METETMWRGVRPVGPALQTCETSGSAEYQWETLDSNTRRPARLNLPKCRSPRPWGVTVSAEQGQGLCGHLPHLDVLDSLWKWIPLNHDYECDEGSKTIIFKNKYSGRGGRTALKRWGTARACTLLVQGIGFLDQVNPGSWHMGL